MAIAPVLLILGIFVFVFFLRTEIKADNPMLDIKMFSQNIPFAFSNIATMINYGSNFALSYLMSIYLQVAKGMPSQQAGLILVTNTVIMALLSPIVGRISDRLSPFKMSAAGMAVCAVALAFLTVLPQDASLPRIITILALSGIGFSLFSSVILFNAPIFVVDSLYIARFLRYSGPSLLPLIFPSYLQPLRGPLNRI